MNSYITTYHHDYHLPRIYLPPGNRLTHEVNYYGIPNFLSNYNRNIGTNINSNMKDDLFPCYCQQKENYYIHTPSQYFLEKNTFAKMKESDWAELYLTQPKLKNDYVFKIARQPMQKNTEYRDYVGKLGKQLLNNEKLHRIFPRYVILNKKKYSKWPIKKTGAAKKNNAAMKYNAVCTC